MTAAIHCLKAVEHLKYLIGKAPLAIITASIPGAINYFLIVLLVHNGGFADAAIFRTAVSIYALFGLATLLETRKSFIRFHAESNRRALRALFRQRWKFIAPALLGGVTIAYGLDVAGANLPGGVVALLLLSAVIYGCDYHLPLLQGQRKFGLLMLLELFKYSLALASFTALFLLSESVIAASLGYFAALAVVHVSVFLIFVLPELRNGESDCPAAAEDARTLSIANILPASLEHVDKLLVGWVFGLEFLGIYVLAYSTGRLVYNLLKPSLYIYYRQFVDRLPSAMVIMWTGISFTFVGIALSAAYLFANAYRPQLVAFQNGSVVTIILFLSYGVGMSRAVLAQAVALNNTVQSDRLLFASIWSTGASFFLLLTALNMPPDSALVLLALQYPLRDSLTILLLSRCRLKAIDG